MDPDSQHGRSEWVDLLGTPRECLAIIFKHRALVLTVFLIIAIPWTLKVILSVPIYQAYGSILLKIGREHIFVPEVGTATPSVYFEREAAIRSEIEILTSPDLAKEVLTSIGVKNIYPELAKKYSPDGDPFPAATGKFLGKLDATGIERSDVIEIKFQHKTPEMAAKAVNMVIEILKAKHLKVFSDPHASFLETQLASYREELTKLENDLQLFKSQNGLTSPIEQQQLLLRQRGALATSLNKIQNEIEGLKSKVASLDRQMQEIPERIPLSTTTDRQRLRESGRSQLLELQRQEQELLTRYTPTSRPVENIRKQISLMEKFISQEQKHNDSNVVTTGQNPVYQNLKIDRLNAESDLKAAQARSEVSTNQIMILDKKLRKLDELNKELQTQQHEIELARQQYKLYLSKVEEAHVSEEMDRLNMSNIRVIQPALVPGIPIGTSKWLKFLLGAVFGVIAGLGLAFAWEFIRGGYRSPDQASRNLGLPVLASVSYKN